MLSTTYLMNASAPPDKNHEKHKKHKEKVMRDIVIVFFALLILDLAFIIYSVHCIFNCSEMKKWPIMLTILLMIMLFLPGIGTLTALGIIIYNHLSCQKPLTSFDFY